MDSAKIIGQRNFEIENDIITEDKIYDFKEDEYQTLMKSKPWNSEYDLPYSSYILLFSPIYFKKVKISAPALIKMVAHAKYILSILNHL